MQPQDKNISELFKVRDINWADPDIIRAGMIPIHHDGKRMWIGLGVSRYAATISTIGGAYEEEDEDLLATAIREYNEEVGPNLPHIVPESVVNCYAIKNSYAILILLPVPKRTGDFIPTEELYTMIWVTPGQLRAMANNQEYTLRGFGQAPKAYAFAMQMQNIIDSLIKAMRSEIPFQLIQDNTPLIRTKRLKKVTSDKLVRDIAILENDSKIPGNFRGHINTVVTKNFIGLMRVDKTVYLLPITDLSRVVTVLNKLGFRVLVGLDSDRNVLLQNRVTYQLLNSIEHLFDQLNNRGIPEAKMFDDFVSKLKDSRKREEITSILDELNLIHDYEIRAYELNQTRGTFFNERRACFLKTLNQINKLLFRRPLPFMEVHRLTDDFCSDFSVVLIINTLISSGVLVQDKQTSILDIPY